MIPASALAAEAEAKAGPIDILVNNAGITRDKMFAGWNWRSGMP
jgi:NAD(P)-dependent dehydrogenase (short-subunit alcohol dehydrogenase family)